jgi:hypothetical protein
MGPLLWLQLVIVPIASAPTDPRPEPAAIGVDQPRQTDAQALEQAIKHAVEADNRADSTMEHINERIQRWTAVSVRAGRGTGEYRMAQDGIARAQDDLQAARTRALEAGNIDESTRGIIDAKLAAARDFIAVKDWAQAEQNIQYVLDQNPTYPPALSLMEEFRRKRSASDRVKLVIAISIALLGAVGLGFIVVRLGLKSREEREKRAVDLAASRSAVLQIVAGIGRGKLVTVGKDKPAFRIGAAFGERGDERNDLVISDSAGLVSRFHCTLIRSGPAYYLVDTSSNGTFLNGEAVGRDDHVLLENGDEIAIAEVSRIKFLYN